MWGSEDIRGHLLALPGSTRTHPSSPRQRPGCRQRGQTAVTELRHHVHLVPLTGPHSPG